jgi:hypothetical protein
MNRHKKLVFAKAAIVFAFLAIVAKSNAQFGPPAHPPLLISEFRERGPNGDLDEYVEIYNNNNKAHTVAGAINSAGYAIVASDGYTRCVIRTGTVIPARGHFLCVNHDGYSLGSYPAGPGTATGDATFSRDIPDNSGLALFNTSNKYSFNLANRIDAIGPREVDALFREGTGFPFAIEGSGAYYRDTCGKHGDTQNFGPCTNAGLPIDTDDNGKDFLYVNVDHIDQVGRLTMGSPGPENLLSPINRGIGADLERTLLDPLVDLWTPPNRVRDRTPGDLNAHFGTLTVRRKFTNRTNSPITALRFRLIDATTFYVSDSADIRALSIPSAWIFTDETPRWVQGTTLEEPPYQYRGGGFNSSLSANGISTWSPLMPGASVNLQFMFGVPKDGLYRFMMVIETLPATASDVWWVVGDTAGPFEAEP